MAKPANLAEKSSKKGQRPRWPFDPMQPGDHEPVPEDAERVQKQTGIGERNRSPKGDRR